MSKQQSIAAVHSWFGLIFGWILFCIFLTGTLTYFRFEISERMRGEANKQVNQTVAIKAIQKKLLAIAPDARRWMFDLPTKRDPHAHLFIWHKDGITPSFQKEVLNINKNSFINKDLTKGGDFFHHFHYDLNLPNPWGRRLVGFAAAIMLVSLISGIITHRRLFKDFFTFRSNKGQRSWLDAHNILGSVALPFHLMVTFTGLIMLIMLYMPWGVKIVYDNNLAPFFNEVFLTTTEPNPTTNNSNLIDLVHLLETAKLEWGDLSIGRVNVFQPNTANAIIELTPSDITHISSHSKKLIFNGSNGAIIKSIEIDRTFSTARGVMYSLHQAHFASPLLRSLYFISGLIGTIMIATGLVLWSIKQKNKLSKNQHPPFFLKYVDILNIGTILGLPFSIAIYLWSNKLIPLSMPGRANLEVMIFFICWAITYLYPCIRNVKFAWKDLMLTNSLIYLMLPILYLRSCEVNFLSALENGKTEQLQLDFFLIATGVSFFIAATKGSHPQLKKYER